MILFDNKLISCEATLWVAFSILGLNLYKSDQFSYNNGELFHK
jgi:hypothetical protein